MITTLRLRRVCSVLTAWGILRVVSGAAACAGAEQPPPSPTAPNTAAAPGVVLVEQERVPAEETMVFIRSQLLEEGQAVAEMRRHTQNIQGVRESINTYRVGYALAQQDQPQGHAFVGGVKGWRARSAGDVSVWPPDTYPVVRLESMRRARLLRPTPVAEACPEMSNLRVYAFPVTIGHDGQQYVTELSALAFFIHPDTGRRMTVVLHRGHAYGAVNAPLTAVSQVYVGDVASYPAGPFGLARARVPSIFYSRGVRFDSDPLPEGNKFLAPLEAVLAARETEPLSGSDFKALYHAMYEDTSTPIADSAPRRVVALP